MECDSYITLRMTSVEFKLYNGWRTISSGPYKCKYWCLPLVSITIYGGLYCSPSPYSTCLAESPGDVGDQYGQCSTVLSRSCNVVHLLPILLSPSMFFFKIRCKYSYFSLCNTCLLVRNFSHLIMAINSLLLFALSNTCSLVAWSAVESFNSILWNGNSRAFSLLMEVTLMSKLLHHNAAWTERKNYTLPKF